MHPGSKVGHHSCSQNRGKLQAFLKHFTAARFCGHHDETAGGSGSGDSVPGAGGNNTESSSKNRAKKLHPWMYKYGHVGRRRHNRSVLLRASCCVRQVMVFLFVIGVTPRVKVLMRLRHHHQHPHQHHQHDRLMCMTDVCVTVLGL